MRAIHQFVAGFSSGDAISNEALVLRDLFRSWSLSSDIFSESRRILPQLRRQCRDVADAAAAVRGDDVVLLHLSIGSPVNEAFRRLACGKAILYHNITPPEYFELVNPKTAFDLDAGRAQARALAGAAAVNMADSAFNAAELAAMGYADPRVLPLVLDAAPLLAPPDLTLLRELGDGRINVAFVGRGAPNKKLEDLLAAFACFQHAVVPGCRLVHAGSFAGTERYRHLLVTQAREQRLQAVRFLGAIPQAQLNAVYRAAHVFVCMSEHEGFCIPLLESMRLDLPVLAFAAGAVPETMDGAGVLFRDKRFEEVAEMMGRLAGDAPLRAAVLEGQRARVARYAARNLGAELREHLAPLLD